MAEQEKISSEKNTHNPWRQAALGTAVVTGVFSLILLTMLSVNYIRSSAVYPLKSERLEMLKLQLAERPNDERLLEQIRRLDVEVRQFSVYKTDFAGRITVYLFIGIILFVISLQFYLSLAKHYTPPAHGPGREKRQVMQTYLSRGVLAVVLVVIAGMTLFYPGMNSGGEGEDETGNVSKYPPPEQLDKNWVRFRGPQGAGISRYTNIPHDWNEAGKKNILWKSEVPLPGYNSPVVWEDRIFLTGAAGPGELKVFCYDLETGRLNWSSPVPSGTSQDVEVMEDTGYAAPTMASNGLHVFAIFATGDIAGFDMNGKMIWHRFLGVPESIYGYASSLEVYEKNVIVQFDQGMPGEGKSKLIVLEGLTGAIVKQLDRPVGSSWASPVVVQVDAAPEGSPDQNGQGKNRQLLTVAEPYAIAYNPQDMTEIWRAKGIGADAAATPIYSAGYAICLSPYDQMLAIRPTGTGDITDTHVAWTSYEGLPDICSPLSDGQRIYLMQTYGTLTCIDIQTGEKLWEHEMGTSFQASPSLVGDKIYLIGAEGKSYIIQPGGEYKQLNECTLEEGAYACPAFVDGKMIVRTKGHLYCIGQTE